MAQQTAEGRNRLVEYLTTAEIAERYRTTEGTVRYWRHVGYGPKGVKVGRRVLYSQESCEAFDRQLAEQGSGQVSA